MTSRWDASLLWENIRALPKAHKGKEKPLKVKSLSSADVKRKNTLVKKSGLLLGAALVLIAAVFMTACSDGSSDGNSSSPTKGKGVLGQISGVVLDASTGLPLKDVTVEIAGKKTATDDLGYYVIDDVISNVQDGKYTVVYYKSGFAPELKTASVDAGEYVKQEPFTKLKELFDAWIKSAHPDLSQAEQLSTWTYSNGVYVNAEGTTVQVTESAAGIPNFELVTGLDYTYKFGQSLATVNLKPLTASLKGKIFLYTTAVNEAVTLKAGVKIQFSYGTEGNEKVYGTGETNDEGAFEVTGLPAYATGLSLSIANFAEGNAYYDGTASFFDGEKFTTATFETAKEASDVPDIYLQGKTDAAYIVDVSAGEPGAPIQPTANITITFSKPIDTKTFTAKIDVSENAKGEVSDESLTFDATWDGNKEIATLTPREKLSSYTTAMLPYSKDSAVSIGTLKIYAKAADGSGILDPENPTTAIEDEDDKRFETNVYTEEGIKLLQVEIIANPTGNAARVVLPVGGALKLTFSKEVASLAGDTSFKIDEVDAAYKVDATDAAIVYVYADKPIGSDVSLTYKVYAADDTFNDTTTDTDVKVEGISGGAYEPVIVKNLYLGKTTSQDKYNAEQLSTNVAISGANANWDRTKKIKIEFTDTVSDIKSLISSTEENKADLYYNEGAVYRVTAKGSDDYAPTLSANNTSVLTITLPPELHLAGGKTFYLAFTFTVDNKTYKIGPKAIYPDAVEEVQITTAPDKAADLEAGLSIATTNATISGTSNTAAVPATPDAFTANEEVEDFTTRPLIAYVKSISNPVWTALTGVTLSLEPKVSNNDSIAAPAFNLGTTPAYNSNKVQVKWRGISSTGRIIETEAQTITFN
jgi:hypothetical protein